MVTKRPDASAEAAAATLNTSPLAARNVQRIAELERGHEHSVSFSERVATAIANFCGSMMFVWLHFLWFLGWILYNTLPWFGPHHADPFPFSFLTLVVSLEAIFLSAFIMISQRREAALADRRSHLDLQINLLAEQESTETLRLLRRIAEHIGIELELPPEVDELEAATELEAVSALIEKNIDGCDTRAS